MNYNKLLSISAAVLLTSGAFVLVVPPAFAKDRPVFVGASPNVVTSHITFADLNLASAAGERTLNHRVYGAIHRLCSDATGGDDGYYVTSFARMKCTKIAWNEARPQIARAVQRSRDIAFTGTSPIAAAAITIDLTK